MSDLINSYNNFSEGEKLLLIKFSSLNQDFLEYNIIAKNTDLFSKVENYLYEHFPKYKNTENFFLYNGRTIETGLTLEENKIKNNSQISIGINEITP